MSDLFKGLKSLLVGVSLALLLPICVSASDDVAVAQVGSITITRYEVSRLFQKILPLSGSYHGGVSKEKVAEVWDKAIDSGVEQALKVMYALDNEVVADVAAVKSQYDKVRAEFSSDEDFEKALSGETPEAFRSSLFRQQLAAAAEKIAVDDKVAVSDDEIRKFYDDNADKFMRPVQYKASHILIKVDPAATSEQRAERRTFANEIHVKAAAGEDFYNLAYYNSDDRTKFVGGDLGFFSADQVVTEFADAVKGLKVGEISPVVESLYGYHIVKLTEIKPEGRMSFDEVQTNLVPQMKQAHRDKLYKDWIDGLRKKYPVKKFTSKD